MKETNADGIDSATGIEWGDRNMPQPELDCEHNNAYLPELGFDPVAAFEEAVKVTDSNERLRRLQSYKSLLAAYVSQMKILSESWITYQGELPFNSPFEDILKYIVTCDSLLVRYEAAIENVDDETALATMVPNDIELKFAHCAPDSLLNLREAADYLGIKPASLSSAMSRGSFRSQRRGTVLFADIFRYKHGFDHPDSVVTEIDATEEVSINDRTNSIRLSAGTSIQLASLIVKELTCPCPPIEKPLIDLGPYSAEEYAIRHFYETGKPKKKSSKIEWEGTIGALVFFVLEIVDGGLVYLPDLKMLGGFILDHFQQRNRNTKKMGPLNDDSLNNYVNNEKNIFNQFNENEDTEGLSATEKEKHFIHSAINRALRQVD